MPTQKITMRLLFLPSGIVGFITLLTTPQNRLLRLSSRNFLFSRFCQEWTSRHHQHWFICQSVSTHFFKCLVTSVNFYVSAAAGVEAHEIRSPSQRELDRPWRRHDLPQQGACPQLEQAWLETLPVMATWEPGLRCQIQCIHSEFHLTSWVHWVLELLVHSQLESFLDTHMQFDCHRPYPCSSWSFEMEWSGYNQYFGHRSYSINCRPFRIIFLYKNFMLSSPVISWSAFLNPPKCFLFNYMIFLNCVDGNFGIGFLKYRYLCSKRWWMFNWASV